MAFCPCPYAHVTVYCNQNNKCKTSACRNSQYFLSELSNNKTMTHGNGTWRWPTLVVHFLSLKAHYTRRMRTKTFQVNSLIPQVNTGGHVNTKSTWICWLPVTGSSHDPCLRCLERRDVTLFSAIDSRGSHVFFTGKHFHQAACQIHQDPGNF